MGDGKHGDKAQSKSLHAGHRQRMRERFMTGGFENYQPHEVLEQLLFEAIPRENTNEIAHRLLDRFGSMDEIFHADKDELLEVNGVGEKSAELILSVYPSISARMLTQFRDAENISIYDIAFMFDWFIKQCRDERLFVMLLGDNGKLYDFIPLSREMSYSPAEISEFISSTYPDADVIYLVSAKEETVNPNFLTALSDIGCNIDDAFYLTSVGFVSVYDPENRLLLYKPVTSDKSSPKPKNKAQK